METYPGGKGPPITVEITVGYSGGLYVVLPSVNGRLCEIGSSVLRDAFAAPWAKHYDPFVREIRRVEAVIQANQAYLLGREGLRVLAETEGDRATVDAVARGAKMDPATGIIPGID